MTLFQFDRETGSEALDDSTWSVMPSDRWNVGDNSNGGYLLSVALGALAKLTDHPDPITVTAHFLRPGIGDTEGIVRGEVVKHGRSLTTIRGGLAQDGKERIQVLAGFGDLSARTSDRSLTFASPPIPPPEDCVPRIGLEQGLQLPILERLDVRVHPDHAQRGVSPKAKVSGWIRFSDGREPDTAALVLFADAFPPSVFALYDFVGWVPTLELTVHVRRRPQPGWILATFETDDLRNDLFVETGSLWDSSGALVARVRQLAMLLPT